MFLISTALLLEGGGTRKKIVDCFAARLAVISTAKGIEGIPIEYGHQALANAGRALVAELDWREITRRWRALYSSLV